MIEDSYDGLFKGMMMAMTKTSLCALLICATGAPFHTCAADESTAGHSGFQFGVGVGGGQLHVSEPDTSASIEMGAFAYTAFAGGWRSEHRRRAAIRGDAVTASEPEVKSKQSGLTFGLNSFTHNTSNPSSSASVSAIG
jgi:hypothetical protein